MIIVDSHCDTLSKLLEYGGNLYSNSYNLDIRRMKVRGNYIQFFAVFVHPKEFKGFEMKRAIELIDKYYIDTMSYSDDVMLCCNYTDIIESIAAGKVATLLTIEGGEVLQGSISALRTFYRLGVRSICLTWNYINEIACGVGDTSCDTGLTTFGREVVKEMNSLGMLIDISHISEKGFWDVLELTEQPVILSHSNSKTICNNKRNLTDEQIHAVGENGGVIGVNFYPSFLNDQGILSIASIIKHIEHIISIIGEDHIGIGADFDQNEPVFDGVDGVKYIDNVLSELLKLNYPYDTVEKIAGSNFLRVIKKVL